MSLLDSQCCYVIKDSHCYVEAMGAFLLIKSRAGMAFLPNLN